MTNIFFASADKEDDATVQALTESGFNVDVVRSIEEYNDDLSKYGLLLIDHSFTPFKGIDFLMQVLSKFHLPALFLSSEKESKAAIEAVNSGAHNYIIKTENYSDFLAFAITDTIRRFNDNTNLRNTIVELKAKISKLEKQLSNSNSASSASAVTPESNILAKLVESLKSGNINLPAYPEISTHFKELANRGASVSEITHCLQKDAAISSKLISLSNSSYYRGMAPIKTLEQSVSRIGTHDVRNYVELIANRGLYTSSIKKYKTYLEDLWKHSLACAYSCQELCRTLVQLNPTELFTMGLFHDIGKLFLIQAMSELESRNEIPADIKDAEWQLLIKTNHAQFGASLMKRWKLSKEYGDVIIGQESVTSTNNAPPEIMVVHLANHISGELGYWDSDANRENIKALSQCKIVEKLNLQEGQLVEIKEKVKELMEAGLTL